jgi:ankyrin repeat protein
MWASAYGQVPTVQLLLQHGAQIDFEGHEGETPLLLAAAGGHHEVVRLLLTEGADVNHGDEVNIMTQVLEPWCSRPLSRLA